MQQSPCLNAFTLALILFWAQPANAQAEPPPIPAPWLAVGVSAWPESSPQLGLEFADIVLPGLVKVKLRSKLQFTQKLLVFTHPQGAPDAAVQVASVNLTAKTGPEFTFSLLADSTQNVVLLAQTPGGWYRAERLLKVGRKP